jgi:hypothetical protein
MGTRRNRSLPQAQQSAIYVRDNLDGSWSDTPQNKPLVNMSVTSE